MCGSCLELGSTGLSRLWRLQTMSHLSTMTVFCKQVGTPDRLSSNSIELCMYRLRKFTWSSALATEFCWPTSANFCGENARPKEKRISVQTTLKKKTIFQEIKKKSFNIAWGWLLVRGEQLSLHICTSHHIPVKKSSKLSWNSSFITWPLKDWNASHAGLFIHCRKLIWRQNFPLLYFEK
jgi:hypothetical protein